MPTKRKMFPVQLYDAELHAALKAKAKAEGCSLTKVVEAACRQSLLPPVVEAVRPPRVAALPSPPPPKSDRPSGPSCVRCGHPRNAHWVRGCLAGCLCSEARFRLT